MSLDSFGEFEEKLTIALRSYITGRIPNAPSKQAKRNRPEYTRQPYLGLSAFDYADAPVFFGRTAQVGEIIAAFQAQEMDSLSSSARVLIRRRIVAPIIKAMIASVMP